MENIKWTLWSEEAFTRARDQNKPVILSISAFWCHWCHVMDKETYGNQEIARLINDFFVPVRVDTDHYPEINNRYNAGGWPSTVFLTYKKDIIAGATYIPADQMKAILNKIITIYRDTPQEVIASAQEERNTQEETLFNKSDENTDIESVYNNVLQQIRQSYDKTYGGFGDSQKFPMIAVLELLLHNAEVHSDEDDLILVTQTLDSMLAGNIFDHVRGGMFRYTTRRDWTSPHYEKILEDNAGIIPVLVRAAKHTGDTRYTKTALQIIEYIRDSLYDPFIGLCRGSQDANEDFYTAAPNERSGMVPPRTDMACYIASNAKIIDALLALSSVEQRSVFIDKAITIANTISSLPRAKDNTLPHYLEGQQPLAHKKLRVNPTVCGFGILDDMVCTAGAYLRLYQTTRERKWLELCIAITETTLQEFSLPNGALSDASKSLRTKRALIHTHIPLSSNARMAILLNDLIHTTQNNKYENVIDTILTNIYPLYENYGILAADYALAVGLRTRE